MSSGFVEFGAQYSAFPVSPDALLTGNETGILGSEFLGAIDLPGTRPDDCTMDSDKNVYTEDDLRNLEQRIDELIDTVGMLKNENSNLRQQKDKLVSERSQLIEKTEMARSRVEAMISRLRSLELGS